MIEEDYDSRLREFIDEIKELDLAAFEDPDSWVLTEDLLNGVDIGYEINSPLERKVLHHIGQRYGLIPLCPSEVVDLAYSGSGDDKERVAVVRTRFGDLPIKPKGRLVG